MRVKQFLVFLLTFALLLSCCPVAGAASTTESGVCGNGLTWTLDNAGTLTISGTGAMTDYDSDRDRYPEWDDLKDNVTSVVIGEGITHVGDLSFYRCTNLASVTLPSTLHSIGECAFCSTKLSSVNLPAGLVSIDDYAFDETSITTLVLPNTVSRIGTQFAGTKLTSITLSAKLSYINSQAFAFCRNLKSITIPASVKYIYSLAFEGSGLQEITFLGDAPSIAPDAFFGRTATCYYPRGNATWTSALNKYGGTLTWVPYGEVPYSLSFSPSSTSVHKGETATVSLRIDTDITVLAGTVTISAANGSGNTLGITSITTNSIAGCNIDYEGAKILIATEETISAGTKIADISFATNASTTTGDYTVTLVSDLYTGDMASDANDQKIDFVVTDSIISVSEVPVTVTWQNEDGTLLEKDEDVTYGSTPVYNGSTPEKNSTAQYTYTFKGWSPAVGTVFTDTVYTATYTETLRDYTLTFQNESGTTIKTLTVPYGTEPEAIIGIPTVPAKEATAEYTYTPNDWGVKKVTGNATYTATYTASKNSYTITWEYEDGTLIDTTTVEYGQTPTYPAPSKDGDVGYTYSFSHWGPAPSAVTGSATYRAVFSSTARIYDVSVSGLVNGAVIVIKDSTGKVVEPANGKYALTYGQTYSYEINAVGYKPVESSFTVNSENTGFVFNSVDKTAVLTFAAMEKLIGDMNNDGAITMADAQALYNYILGRYTIDNEGKAYSEGQLVFNLNVADVNNNGSVGSDDILPILRLINASA